MTDEKETTTTEIETTTAPKKKRATKAKATKKKKVAVKKATTDKTVDEVKEEPKVESDVDIVVNDGVLNADKTIKDMGKWAQADEETVKEIFKQELAEEVQEEPEGEGVKIDTVPPIEREYIKRLEDELIQLKKQAMVGTLTTKVEEVDEVEAVKPEQEVNNRDVTRKSDVIKPKNERAGMSFGGPSTRPKKGGTVAKPKANSRRGVHKVWPDRPVNNVGNGVNVSDIAKERQKNG